MTGAEAEAGGPSCKDRPGGIQVALQSEPEVLVELKLSVRVPLCKRIASDWMFSSAWPCTEDNSYLLRLTPDEQLCCSFQNMAAPGGPGQDYKHVHHLYEQQLAFAFGAVPLLAEDRCLLTPRHRALI